MEPMSALVARTQYPSATAFSALPDAPVVSPSDRRPHFAAARRQLAASLHHLADAVAPARPPAARHTAYAGTR